MTLIAPKIIAPDSSHWAKWLDAMSARDEAQRRGARDLHGQLMDKGRIPLLCWHHLEELLGGRDEGCARTRVTSLQNLPMLAYLRLPRDELGLGSIVEVLAAEAIAVTEGYSDLISIRDRARELLLKVGPGTQAVGEEDWVWDEIRPMLRSRQDKNDMRAALGPLRTFDDNRTIGELAKSAVNSPDQMRAQLGQIRAKAFQEATQSTGGDVARARVMAADFVAPVVAMRPPAGTTVRDLLVAILVEQGVDEEEIRDECVLADLIRLAVFRSQLRVVASQTGLSFATLKKVPMDILPSRIIGDALRTHGQPRPLRPGSDLNDRHLGVLAAYCAVLYVDKRTAEDFTRAQRKESRLKGLIGEVAKAADFEALLGPTPG